MIYLILSAVLVVESLALNPEVQHLLQLSPLLGCGTCSICSTCYSNCAPENIGFDQNKSLTSICTQPTDSVQFWGCLCIQAPVSSLVGSVSASLAACPASYPNDTVSAVLTEFTIICTSLGYPAPNFSTTSKPSTTSLTDLLTSSVATGNTLPLSNSETIGASFSGTLSSTSVSVVTGISPATLKVHRISRRNTYNDCWTTWERPIDRCGRWYRGWNIGSSPFDKHGRDILCLGTSR